MIDIKFKDVLWFKIHLFYKLSLADCSFQRVICHTYTLIEDCSLAVKESLYKINIYLKPESDLLN